MADAPFALCISKVSYNAFALRRQHGFRVKLNAFHRIFPVPQSQISPSAVSALISNRQVMFLWQQAVNDNVRR